MDFMDDFGTWMWATMVVSFLVPVAIVAMVIFGIRRSTRGKDPVQILDERFAKGEIDRSEYDARRSALEQHDGTT